MIKLGEKILPLITGGIEKLGQLWDDNKESLTALASTIKDKFLKAWEDAGPVIDLIVQKAIELKDEFLEFWAANKDMIIPTLEFLAKVLGGALLAAILTIVEMGRILVQIWGWQMDNIWRPLAEFVINTLIPAFQAFWAEVGPVLGQFWELAKMVFGWIWGVAGPLLMGWMELIKASWDIGWSVISAILKNVWTVIKTTVLVGWEFLKGIINTGMAILKGDWKGAWESIKNTLSGVWDRIKNGASEAVNTMVGFFMGFPERVAAAISGLSGVIMGAIGGAVRAVPGIGDKLADGLGLQIGGHMNAGQVAEVNERGGEMFQAQVPGQVMPAGISRKITQNFGGNTFNVQGGGDSKAIARELDARQARRNQSAMQGLSPALG